MKVSNSAERLKELMKILNIKQSDIVEKTDIPRSAVSMYVSGQRIPRQDRLSMIADSYNISETWLMGYDVPMARTEDKETILTQKDERDIFKILAFAKEQLLSQEGLMCDGNPVTPEAIESILSAMEIGMEMAKKKNKEKYTPKKYKKD